MLQEQLTDYFLTNNLFAPQQYGFRKNSSTELAALELIDRLLNEMNNHKILTNFYIDLSKAFDSLQHDILLEKLAHYSLRNKAIALLKSYLSNRKQYVQLNDVSSSVRSISVGVPQGFILGPLLFNIFINDIVKSSTKFKFILYADDTTLNSTLDSFGQDAVEVQNTIVSELQNIFKWLDVNRLCLNVAKSKFMLFHMPQKEIPQLSFNINGIVIEHVKEFNFLGLILDSNLNWKAHLKVLCGSAKNFSVTQKESTRFQSWRHWMKYLAFTLFLSFIVFSITRTFDLCFEMHSDKLLMKQLNIGSLNLRGLLNDDGENKLYKDATFHGLDIIALSETHIKSEQHLDLLKDSNNKSEYVLYSTNNLND